MTAVRSFETPREDGLGLRRIESGSGVAAALLPNGCIFGIEHRSGTARTLITQIEGSELDGGIGRLFLRVGSPGDRQVIEAVGSEARVQVAVGDDRFIWEGEGAGVRHRVSLWLHPGERLWLWHVEATNTRAEPFACDATLVQDIGIGGRGFIMSNEAYASQYIDHHPARHPAAGWVVMSRQNLAQGGAYPWVAHGCREGAASFATDARQLLGPEYRDAGRIDPEQDLPGACLQHEVACPMIRSAAVTLAPGETAAWSFFGVFDPDHRAASGDADLGRIDAALAALDAFEPRELPLTAPARSLLQDAAPLAGQPLTADAIDARYPGRRAEERDGSRLLSFFLADGALNRHVVLREKERPLPRRHGTIVRTGQGMLLDETTMCTTVWMHGVFGSLLSVGNTSFHRLFSASRDPYNITRSGGLRILIETEGGWRLLAEPSVFEIGLSDCRWVYVLDDRTVTVEVVASGDDPAMQWRLVVEGVPCRFLVAGGIVLGERELDSSGRVEIDAGRHRIAFRPDPAGLWGKTYPDAVYHLVTATPDAVEAIGGDELLFADGAQRGGGFVALRTRPTTALEFSVVGVLADPEGAARLADRYAAGVPLADGLASAARYWTHVTRRLRLRGGANAEAVDTFFPWVAQNAIIHLTVPHGLEQSGGAAWGTRDVCQGPVEFLLALDHDGPVREIIRTVFAQQFETRGDWPQWFMLEPYGRIRDRHSHGDVIIWPLKALCDYIEATGDVTLLDEAVAWRNDEDLTATTRHDPISAHVEKLLATVRDRFIPDTHLIRYGEGDWNDSLQPADPNMRDWMVSSWTVALLFQQLERYAAVLARAGRGGDDLAALAEAIRTDFDRWLVRDGTVAGYALFEPGAAEPELLLHPSDRRTGLHYSLLPMTQGIVSGLFDAEAAQHHQRLVAGHLTFPDGIRLMDKPVTYHGGPEHIFRRAESAAFFGREIGLLYIHAHLRHGEALAALGEAEGVWQVLAAANPVVVADRVANATRRQRNAYFSSSDAAFPDRYSASADWQLARLGEIAADGGWRIYSSGPGLFTNLFLCHAFGLRRRPDGRRAAPVLPAGMGPVTLEWEIDGRPETWVLGA